MRGSGCPHERNSLGSLGEGVNSCVGDGNTVGSLGLLGAGGELLSS